MCNVRRLQSPSVERIELHWHALLCGWMNSISWVLKRMKLNYWPLRCTVHTHRHSLTCRLLYARIACMCVQRKHSARLSGGPFFSSPFHRNRMHSWHSVKICVKWIICKSIKHFKRVANIIMVHGPLCEWVCAAAATAAVFRMRVASWRPIC